jgi:hypothetical protein
MMAMATAVRTTTAIVGKSEDNCSDGPRTVDSRGGDGGEGEGADNVTARQHNGAMTMRQHNDNT